jgi:hypothetical protein
MSFAFVLSIGATAYAPWITAYWRGAALSGTLALTGLSLEWTARRPRHASPAREDRGLSRRDAAGRTPNHPDRQAPQEEPALP